jgi:hypothetical protein
MFALLSANQCNGFRYGGVCFDTTVNLALFVPFATFALTYLYDRWKKRREAVETKIAKERFKQKFFKALALEIKRNLSGIENAILSTPAIHEYQDFFASNPKGRPVVSVYYDSTIYSSNIPLLLELQESLADSIVALYADLKTLEVEASTVQQRGFTTVSQKSRIDIMLGLGVAQEKIAVRAKGLLKELELVTEQPGRVS